MACEGWQSGARIRSSARRSCNAGDFGYLRSHSKPNSGVPLFPTGDRDRGDVDSVCRPAKGGRPRAVSHAAPIRLTRTHTRAHDPPQPPLSPALIVRRQSGYQPLKPFANMPQAGLKSKLWATASPGVRQPGRARERLTPFTHPLQLSSFSHSCWQSHSCWLS